MQTEIITQNWSDEMVKNSADVLKNQNTVFFCRIGRKRMQYVREIVCVMMAVSNLHQSASTQWICKAKKKWFEKRERVCQARDIA